MEQQEPLDAYSQAVVRAVEVVGPAVVRVGLARRTPDPWRPRGMPEMRGAGSGVIITPDSLEADRAARVVHVEPASAADRAGLRPGDLVVRASDRVVRGPKDLQLAVAQHPPGQPLEV